MESNIQGNHEDLIQFWRERREERGFSVTQEEISSGQVSTAEQIREFLLVYIFPFLSHCKGSSFLVKKPVITVMPNIFLGIQS